MFYIYFCFYTGWYTNLNFTFRIQCSSKLGRCVPLTWFESLTVQTLLIDKLKLKMGNRKFCSRTLKSKFLLKKQLRCFPDFLITKNMFQYVAYCLKLFKIVINNWLTNPLECLHWPSIPAWQLQCPDKTVLFGLIWSSMM